VATVWLDIVTVMTVFSLAILSPGPNFLLVLNRTVEDSRQTGLYTALGVATGSALFALAGMFGLLLVISHLSHFALVIRTLGGIYLAWLGIGMLRKLFTQQHNSHVVTGTEQTVTPPLRAYRTGLFTNLANPKAWAFYLSLFALVVSPATPATTKWLLVLAMFLISFGWYATVALLISNQLVQPLFLRFQKVFLGCVALMLIWLGGSLLFLR